MTAVVGTSIRHSPGSTLVSVAILVAFVGIVYAVASLLKGREPGKDPRPPVKRVLLAGIVAWALCHLALVLGTIQSGRSLALLGARVTPRDQAYGAVLTLGTSWTGTGLLALCFVAAGALILSGRGRRRGAGSLLAGVGLLIAVAPWRGRDDDRISRLDPGPIPASTTPGGFLVTETPLPLRDPWRVLEPMLRLLLVPAGLVVLAGLASILRTAARRKPWPCPPTDALLLAGTAAAVCVAVLHVESAFMERAWVVILRGPRSPPATLLLDDFLRAAAPGAAILWTGAAVLSLGLLDRARGRGVEGGDGR